MSSQKLNRFFYKRARIQQFRGFCSAAQFGIREAARRMNIEPSTVSIQVKALEDDLGVTLFNRSSDNKIVLTEDGIRLYERLIPIIQGLDCVLDDFLTEKKVKHEDIILGGHRTVLYYLIPHCVDMFYKEKGNNATKFILHNVSFEDGLQKLLNEEVDIVLHPYEQVPPRVTVQSVLELHSCILMHKDNPLALKPDHLINFSDLNNQSLIMIDDEKILPYFAKTVKAHNLCPKIEFVNGDWELVRNFVKLNLGVHLYSKLYSIFESFQDKDLALKDVNHLFPSIKVYVVTKAGKFLNDDTRLLINIIRKVTSANNAAN